MTTKELYIKGARVWIPHADKVWESAELLEDYKPSKSSLQIQTDDSQQKRSLGITSDSDLPPLRNPDILIGEKNLTSLSFLHEPGVLFNLHIRFQRHSIYTYCGIILVAFNPYNELPIYSNETIWAYRGQAIGDLEPHIFAVAEEAYTKLERESHDQSVIVSGESGAGKTVSAKYAMRYFATVGGSSKETQVEKKVLASSFIMEAVGNAKTTRNDNSSRFGKFIEIHFNKNCNIIGASMRTYLLEKSRVVFQGNGERNYHIFYQICAASKRLPQLHLDHQQNFHYLNQGSSPNIEAIDDFECFNDTMAALSMLGFTSKQQDDMLKIFASILHLGNVVVEGLGTSDTESSFISETDKNLLIMTELLGLDLSSMQKWLAHRKIVSMRDIILKPMNIEQAVAARDALAKHIYAKLFSWIVAHVNASLESISKAQNFIGILDIYGFETFETNSFEQFCINYANEKLQQQFNQHVFKLEQEEYIKEEIEWLIIDFHDNQPCIDLIETKLGILDLLDEECRMPRGSDSSWVEKLYSECSKSKFFQKARFGTSAFLIHHFADIVQYETTGFLEKNRDSILEEQIDVLRNSENILLKEILSQEASNFAHPDSKVKVSVQKQMPVPPAKNKKTVGSQFRESLNMLMSTLNSTIPHYVRCIKPNDTKESFEFNPVRAVQQLRACGVLETIRISAAGFPSQRTYLDFFQRYRCLCKFKDIKRDNLTETCRKMLDKYIKDSDKFKFGKTKILFRAGQVAYLEKLRADKQRDACLIIQKTFRGWITMSRYKKIQHTILGLQRFGRGCIARRQAQKKRERRAAIIIQAWIRRWLHRIRYSVIKSTIMGLQTRGRGFLARKRFARMKDEAKVVQLQRYARGYLARQSIKLRLRKIVIIQSCIRKFLAKRILKRLKTEARSVEHVKSLNKGLERKIINLQHRINELTKENQYYKTVELENGEMKKKIESCKAREVDNKKLNDIILEKDHTIKNLLEKIEVKQNEKFQLLQVNNRIRTHNNAEEQRLKHENEKLQIELAQLQEKVHKTGIDEDLKSRFEREKDLLLMEQDQSANAYQRLLKEHTELEQKNKYLNQKLATLIPEHSRSLSNASSGSGASQMIITELSNDDQNIDFGYGSVRSTSSSSVPYSQLEAIDWNEQSYQSNSPSHISSNISSDQQNRPNHAPFDVSLVLKLQQKLKDIEKEKGRLVRMVENLEHDCYDEFRVQDTFRLQELEIENAQLKKDLGSLRKSVIESDTTMVSKNLHDQFQALQEELERRREECIQLHSVLADHTQHMKNTAANYGHEVDIVNEDGELILAFEAQKKINRQLENELQGKEQEWKSQREEWRAEIDRLQEEIQRQQKLISINLSMSPQTQTEAIMHFEITRVTSENLDLQEKYDKAAEDNRRLKKQIILLQKRLKDAGLPEGIRVTNSHDITSLRVQANDENSRTMPAIRKKERDYEGMFEFRKEDINLIIRNLVYELNPRTAITLLPGLPAYILFMCIRHTDFINDEDKVRELLTAYLNTVKRVVKRPDNFEYGALWLSNTLRLIHSMKQYSGDKPFQLENTPRQNDQCLRNFDLGEYRDILNNLSISLFNQIISQLKDRVHPLTVPALLEHEAITGLSSTSRSLIVENPEATQQKLNSLLKVLQEVNKQFIYHGIDTEVRVQIFKQLFYFMCGSALNNLLLRNELCHWSKGMQIRFNLSHLEQWARDEKLQPATEALQPIIQAAQLLQARKQLDEDVISVCDMCSKLSANQIVKILNLYTPADEYETRVPVSFIKKVEEKLRERQETNEQLLMDLKYSYPVRFSFNPSDIRLADIEVPEIFKLSILKKI